MAICFNDILQNLHLTSTFEGVTKKDKKQNVKS